MPGKNIEWCKDSAERRSNKKTCEGSYLQYPDGNVRSCQFNPSGKGLACFNAEILLPCKPVKERPKPTPKPTKKRRPRPTPSPTKKAYECAWTTNVGRNKPVWGSSDSQWGRYSEVNDGSTSTRWHAGDNDGSTSYLIIDLGQNTKIDSMQIETSWLSPNYGFHILEIYRSVDNNNFQSVRTENIATCSINRITQHQGWPEATRYIKIVMKTFCDDKAYHFGEHFSIAEWTVNGCPAEV